jgi:hypothetical protein
LPVERAFEDVSKVRRARPEETRDPDWRPYNPADRDVRPLYTEEQEREIEDEVRSTQQLSGPSSRRCALTLAP